MSKLQQECLSKRFGQSFLVWRVSGLLGGGQKEGTRADKKEIRGRKEDEAREGVKGKREESIKGKGRKRNAEEISRKCSCR